MALIIMYERLNLTNFHNHGHPHHPIPASAQFVRFQWFIQTKCGKVRIRPPTTPPSVIISYQKYFNEYLTFLFTSFGEMKITTFQASHYISDLSK